MRKRKLEESIIKDTMAKVRNFAEITPNLPFTEYNFYEAWRETFDKTELGKMKRILPLHEMAQSLGLVNESLRLKRGRRSYFTPEGKVALMFELPETDGSAERQHLIPDVLRHRDRPVPSSRELQTAGQHRRPGTGREAEDPGVAECAD